MVLPFSVQFGQWGFAIAASAGDQRCAKGKLSSLVKCAEMVVGCISVSNRSEGENEGHTSPGWPVLIAIEDSMHQIERSTPRMVSSKPRC